MGGGRDTSTSPSATTILVAFQTLLHCLDSIAASTWPVARIRAPLANSAAIIPAAAGRTAPASRAIGAAAKPLLRSRAARYTIRADRNPTKALLAN
jgi:hypothetical protein